jgi:hypothetical protein
VFTSNHAPFFVMDKDSRRRGSREMGKQEHEEIKRSGDGGEYKRGVRISECREP